MHFKCAENDDKEIKKHFHKAFPEEMRRNQSEYDMNSNFLA